MDYAGKHKLAFDGGIALCALMLAGCGGDDDDSVATQPSVTVDALTSTLTTSLPGTTTGTTPTAATGTPPPAATGTTPTPATGTTPTAATGTTSASAIGATVYLGGVELRAEDPSVGGQYVLLVNPTGDNVDVTCWAVSSTATGLSAMIVEAPPLAAGASLRLVPDAHIFNSPDSITLLDGTGREIDHTPELADQAGDDQAWFRDAGGEWRFGRNGPAQSGDGRLVVAPANC